MIEREVIITKTVDFLNNKLNTLASQNPIINIFRPAIARVFNNNISKLDSILKLLQDSNGMVDVEGIIDETIDNLLVSKIKQYPEILGGVEIGEGTIRVNLPIINKAVVLDTDDINSFKEVLLKKQ